MGNKTCEQVGEEQGWKRVFSVGRRDEKEDRESEGNTSTAVPPSSSVIYVSSWQRAFRRRDQR